MWKKYHIAENLTDALLTLKENPRESKIIAGGTDLMLEIKRGLRPEKQIVIDLTHIAELKLITLDDNGDLHIGALVTHNEAASSTIIQKQAHALAEACYQVGSPQIRNRGTIVGNLVTASPANDTIPALLALDAEIVLASASGERILHLDSFYLGVRKTVLAEDEIVKEIIIRSQSQKFATSFYKLALRNAQAISVVNAAVAIKLTNSTIENVKIAVGSVAPTVVRLKQLEASLINASVSNMISLINEAPLVEISPISDVRSSDRYRLEMSKVVIKRCLEAALDSEKSIIAIPDSPITLAGSAETNPKTVFTSTVLIDQDNPIRTTINGYSYVFQNAYQKSLLDLIRDNAGLTGSKEGCAEGECGACTVHLDGSAVMACLVPAPRAHLAEIVTIEGISTPDKLHPIQEAFIEEGAVQCGYCTPGFIMSAVKLLEEQNHPDQDQIKSAITGNLCRCTGYYKIIKAIEKAAEKGQE